MRKISKSIISAFQAGESKSVDNTCTDGKAIWLHGNKIAEKRGAIVFVSSGQRPNGEFFPLTSTTKERLKALGASVYTQNGNHFLNGVEWGGEWQPLTDAFRAKCIEAAKRI